MLPRAMKRAPGISDQALFDAELPPDESAERVLDLGMPWNRYALAVGRIDEDVVASTMAQKLAAGAGEFPANPLRFT